jgi:hypothetical protein
VSAVAVKLITFQKFHKFEYAFSGFLSIIDTIAEALCVEREMNVGRLVAFFQVLILDFGTAVSVLKNKNTNILCDDNPSVLWLSMKTVVNFMRRLTSINVLCLA